MTFPAQRPRRLRSSENIRRMVGKPFFLWMI